MPSGILASLCIFVQEGNSDERTETAARETLEHRTRADSCMEMSCSARSGKCQSGLLCCLDGRAGALVPCHMRDMYVKTGGQKNTRACLEKTSD